MSTTRDVSKFKTVMWKIQDKLAPVFLVISFIVCIGGSYQLALSVLGYITGLMFRDVVTVIFTVTYIICCIHIYLVTRNEERDRVRWHQGWVGRQLKRMSIKIEKNGKVVLDTTNKLSYIDEMKFYDKSELVNYLLGD